MERAGSHCRNPQCDRHCAAIDLGRAVFRADHPEGPLRGTLEGACTPRHGRHDEHRLPHTVPVDELRRIWSTDLAGSRIDPETLAYVLSYALAASTMMTETLYDLALDADLEAGEIDTDLITQPLILEALAEGKVEGRADLLLRLFRQRFGAIPEGVEVKVRSAPLQDLEAWADALFDARKLDDVFRNGGAP